ncbi:MAG: FmdB family transcriptional regulator [Acidobacteria bacterium]|nr:FmdB family transcriptional regulator [Acidobacteriota bacterium]
MPLYEYECDTCGHRFEVIHKFSDPPITVCPKCQSAVRKLFSSPAIQFKGTGWYITDYARKNNPGAGSNSNDSGGDKGEKRSQEKGEQGSQEKSDKSEKGEKGGKSGDSSPSTSSSSSDSSSSNAASSTTSGGDTSKAPKTA